MAVLLLLDKRQIFEGDVTLFRGDRWNLDCFVVDQVCSVTTPKSLVGAGVTGFFPGFPDLAGNATTVAATGTLTNAEAGAVRFSLAPDVTPLVVPNQNGISFYAVVDGVPEGPYTAAVSDPPVRIVDRGFGNGCC